MKTLEEFKKFAMRGNVIDMAVGIIIGAAFGKIVTSAVKDLVMPPIGLMLGGVDFKDLAIVLKEGTPAAPAVKDASGVVVTAAVEAVPAVAINYGMFINTVVDFLIIAIVIFLTLRTMNKLKAEEPDPEPTEKKCDFCLSKVKIQATRCPHCTSELATAT